MSGPSVSSTTSSFVLRRRAHNADIWFFQVAPRPYRRPHRARNVLGALFGQLDKFAGMRWHPTRFLLPTTLLARKNGPRERSFELSIMTGGEEDSVRPPLSPIWLAGAQNLLQGSISVIEIFRHGRQSATCGQAFGSASDSRLPPPRSEVEPHRPEIFVEIAVGAAHDASVQFGHGQV